MVADALANADHIAGGLEAGPIRYVAALSLVVNAVLFALLYRVQALRVAELKEWAAGQEHMGGVVEKLLQGINAVDRLSAFVSGQLPRKRSDSGVHPAAPAVKP